MITIKKNIAEKISAKIAAVYGAEMAAADIEAMLEYPPDSKMGDLALPCFKLSRTLRNAPVKIAQSIAEDFALESVERADAVNGYFNIYLSADYMANAVLPAVHAKGERYGAPNMGEGRTVVLDYSSPNVAKPFHIGHLGTTVIGHSLKCLHEFA